MEKLIIRWTQYVPEVMDEETGEVIEQSHYESHHEVVNLKDILTMETHWKGVTITLVDGTSLKTTDDECYIFFR